MTARDKLKQEMEEARKDGGFVCLWPQEAFDLIAEFEQRERKVERLIRAAAAAVADSGLHAQELHKGRYGSGSRLWREYEQAVADLQADSPPPIARDPIPDTGGKIKW